MRRICFRGKRIDNDEWVYGCYNYTFERGYFSQGYDDVPPRCDYIDTDTNYYEIHRSTLGQLIGLQDINGLDIFEGDILLSQDNFYKKVVFNNGCFKVADIKHPNSNLHLLEYYASYSSYVGNIHDNPELLE